MVGNNVFHLTRIFCQKDYFQLEKWYSGRTPVGLVIPRVRGFCVSVDRISWAVQFWGIDAGEGDEKNQKLDGLAFGKLLIATIFITTKVDLY
jgi:hypothetical protein